MDQLVLDGPLQSVKTVLVSERLRRGETLLGDRPVFADEPTDRRRRTGRSVRQTGPVGHDGREGLTAKHVDGDLLVPRSAIEVTSGYVSGSHMIINGLMSRGATTDSSGVLPQARICPSVVPNAKVIESSV